MVNNIFVTNIFKDRQDAGQFLAKRLQKYRNRDDVVVLGLPRGGVPVAYEVAKALHAPLDIFLVRKLGVPGFEEYAMGAIASGGIRVLNQALVSELDIPEQIVDEVTAREFTELERQERLYRGARHSLDVTGKTAIVVDDGMATGFTMRAAVRALRKKNPRKIVIAVPVGDREVCNSFTHEADTIAICATMPQPFHAVGGFYRHFSQTTDAEVRQLLSQVQQTKAAA
ncbi:MAG TPA: phosphoribosyltransferase [Pyrinomonadaceae bacterium]|nr:phosphoribosyltransferase [Pyrinomonadaceae bacterium]